MAARGRSRCNCGALAIQMMDDQFFCKYCLPKHQLKKGYAEEVKVQRKTRVTKVVHEEINNTGPGCACEAPKKKRWWEKLLDYVGKGGPPGNCC